MKTVTTRIPEDDEEALAVARRVIARAGVPVVVGVSAPGFAAILVAALVALERWRPWRQDLGSDHDGLGTGATEAAQDRRGAPEQGPHALAVGPLVEGDLGHAALDRGLGHRRRDPLDHPRVEGLGDDVVAPIG